MVDASKVEKIIASMIRLQANNRYDRLSFSADRLDFFFDTLCRQRTNHGLSGELSLAFLSDLELAEIHDEFLDDPSPTDVITFPGDSESDLAGEICVSVERAEAESLSRGEPFSQELALYLVHGWLHLLGLNDFSDEERREMRRAESETLNFLSEIHAIPDFRLAPKLPEV